MKTPELLTLATKRPYRSGAYHCYFCGGTCDASNPAKSFVPDTFTAIGGVARPGSGYVCDGCVWTQRMADELTIEGEARTGQKPWNYSWVASAGAARPLTKSHIAILREVCLNPPDPPFAIALAASGQRHVIYLTPVNEDRDSYAISLEGESIGVTAESLATRLDLAAHVCAATGKPRLSEQPTFSVHRDVMARYRDGEAIADEWSRVWSEPLSRLAVFLTDKKEICDERYPSTATA